MTAVATTLPALYTIAAVLVSTFVVGFIGAGMAAIVRTRRRERRRKMSRPIRIAGALILIYFLLFGPWPLFYTLHLAFGQTLAGIFLTITPGVLFLVLCFTVLRYDLLTSVFAVATATLFTVNTTAMWLLEDLGNATQTGLFVVWGAIVLFAAGIAFRQPLLAFFLKTKSELG